MQMLLKFQSCPQLAEKYILRLILKKFYFLTIIGLHADLDLSDLGALVTGPKSAMSLLTHLQAVEEDIELLPLLVEMSAKMSVENLLRKARV